MKNFLTLIMLLSFQKFAFGQIFGEVVNPEGEPLPYVNVFVKNTSTGTTTNFDGAYQLKLDPGEYIIVFQYIGYQSQEKSMSLKQDAIELNVVMKDMAYTMPEITITADGEDPAYAIIRKAQEKRKYYLSSNTEYVCDAYVRGFNKIFNAPEKIMGVDIGDMDGALDSTRQGVVYLSESISKLYVSGSKSKEVMTSSKISGNDQGYSFNSAQEMDFNFYENTLELNKRIISPIASNALNHYDYILEGAHLDENSQLVNKIKVIPKNDYAPCFFGYIYINEDLWNINSLELGVTNKATQLSFIDTLTFKQSFIPLKNNDWKPISNVIEFRMSAFGFDVGGSFACVYSNYLLGPIEDSVFNNEIYVVEQGANEKSEIYWDSIRPIPLTIEEKLDYKRKDSIRIVRESPEYLDSIDRKSNRFKLGSLLTSYSHQNSKKRINWSISSPLTNLDVNTIQGWNGSLGLAINKYYDKKRSKSLSVTGDLNYSFSTHTWRPSMKAIYTANQTNNLSFELTGGREVTQFNNQPPITERLNTIMTLFFRRNYLKAYDKNYVQIKYSQNLGAILFTRISLEYADRNALTNNYDGSLFYKDSRTFTDNLQAFEQHQALILRSSFRIKFGEKLVKYPDRIFRIGSDWPTIWLHYKQAFGSIAGSDVSYKLFHASISKQYTLGNLGSFNFYAHGGTFIEKSTYFVDAFHFLGNQTHIGYTSSYYYSFLLLPYYSYSTYDDFAQLHLQHNMKGWLLGKIPGIRRLNFHLVGGFKYLLLNGTDYQEWHVGLDNIGYKFFRFFRVDAVWSKELIEDSLGEEDKTRFGVVVGLSFKL